MKKIVKTFTFWFAVVSLIVIVINLLNYDDMNILMMGFNPILFILSSSELCEAIGNVPYLWHILSFVTMIWYGLILDAIRTAIKKHRKSN